MSHKFFDGRKVENATPEVMREEVDKYFAHLQQHDPKRLEFAIMITGHGEADGGTRVCSMVGGPPEAIVHVITNLMDELIKQNPVFAVFFLMSFLRRMNAKDLGGADVETQVKNLLDRVRDNTPPNRSTH